MLCTNEPRPLFRMYSESISARLLDARSTGIWRKGRMIDDYQDGLRNALATRPSRVRLANALVGLLTSESGNPGLLIAALPNGAASTTMAK